MNKNVRRVLLVILIGIFCFSTGKVVFNKLQDAREQKASQELAAQVHAIEQEMEMEEGEEEGGDERESFQKGGEGIQLEWKAVGHAT